MANRNVLEWYKAAQLLDIPECEWGQAWPEFFNAHDLATLQEPNDEPSRIVLEKTISTTFSGKEINRPPNDKDVGQFLPTVAKPHGELITRNHVLAVGLFTKLPQLNGDHIIERVYCANEVKNEFANLNIEPSVSVNNWLESHQPQSKENNSYRSLLEKLVTSNPKFLEGEQIADLWAYEQNKQYDDNDSYWQIRDEYVNQIKKAITEGELEAIAEERVEDYDDGFRQITDKNRIRKIRDGWLNGTFVKFSIHRDQFQQWLQKTNQWPINPDCLLSKWFETEQTNIELNSESPNFTWGVTVVQIERKYGTEIKVNDWDYWLHLDSWTPEEATCLFYEVDPDRLKQQGQKPLIDAIFESDEQLAKLHRLLKNKKALSPPEWKQFALEKNICIPHKLEVLKVNTDDDTDWLKTQAKAEANEREFKKWMRETWENEGKPEAREFFPKILKKYKNKTGSPILQVYTAGKEAGIEYQTTGIEYQTSSGTRKSISKKTIGNYVSDFKRTSQ